MNATIFNHNHLLFKMVIMKKIYFLLISIFLISCNQNDDDTLLLRIKNTSQFDYTDVVVNTSGGEHNYGTVNANQISDYKVFDLAYRYAFVELKIDGDTYTIQPIDYVGETPLDNGKYTYEINAANSGDQYSRLTLILAED